VDKLITVAKKDDLHARRQATALLKDKTIVRRLFEDVAPELDDRNSGFTRILKLGPRLGDGAEAVYWNWSTTPSRSSLTPGSNLVRGSLRRASRRSTGRSCGVTR
jgi:hypothetical protein